MKDVVGDIDGAALLRAKREKDIRAGRVKPITEGTSYTIAPGGEVLGPKTVSDLKGGDVLGEVAEPKSFR